MIRGALAHPGHARHVLTKRWRLHRRSRLAPDPPRLPRPMAYSLQLTRRCNLRCRHCFQWGERGLQQDGSDPPDLPWPVAEKVLARLGPDRAYLVLWGGEPFLWDGIEELVDRAEERGAWSAICTNGTLLDQRLDWIRRRRRLNLLVSLDGPREVCDAIRGDGVYDQVTRTLRELQSRRPHPYLGVEITVLPETVSRLTEFCREMARLGCHWVALNQRWFLSEEQQRDHAAWTERHFAVRATSQSGYDAPGFDLDRAELIRQHCSLRRARLPLRLVWQPPLTPPERIHDYLDRPAQPLTDPICRKHSIQMDILADGRVVTCKAFPDLLVGDLNRQEVEEAWGSPIYQCFRGLLQRDAPLPVCAKCPSLAWFGRR